MTHYQRIAAGECIRIMTLLVESQSPHSKQLATLVGARLVAIADSNELIESPSPSEIESWVNVARALVLEDQQQHSERKEGATIES